MQHAYNIYTKIFLKFERSLETCNQALFFLGNWSKSHFDRLLVYKILITQIWYDSEPY